MEVVRSNFSSHLESVLEDIRTCDFISCDGEFTGISNADFKAMPFDTVAERYEKLRQGNMEYLMCQVGLCMFFQDAETGSYTVKPYNFYVMPRPFFARSQNSPEFVCQSSCINFLATHGFDFNKVFLDGIPYLRPADESKIRDILMEKEEQRKAPTSSTPLHVKPDDKKFVDAIIAQVDTYLANASTDTEPLALEPCSPWRRKLTYQNLESKYPDSIHLQPAGEGRQRHIIVSKVDMEQKLAKERASFEKKLEELATAVGFTAVIKEISRCRRHIIGHNMLLDVMYIISQFMAALPESYEEFKAMCTELFPRLLDTKVMSSTYLFKEEIQYNSLDEMVKVLESSAYEQVKIDIPESFPDYTEPNGKSKFHDAAYDAFVTGKCFATMALHVGRQADPPVHNLASNSRLLTPFINKLFVNRLQEIPYMNIGGPEVVPERDHVYHVTFPTTWTRTEINKVFYPSLIYVSWIDTSSAMITLQQRTENSQVREMLKSKAHGCVIQTYEEWHRTKLLSKTNPTAPLTTATHPTSAKVVRSEQTRNSKKHKQVGTSASHSGAPSKLKKSKLNLIEAETPESANADAPASSVDGEVGRKKPDKLFEESSW